MVDGASSLSSSSSSSSSASSPSTASASAAATMSSAPGATSDAARLRGVTVVKPIVFGNLSQHFGKKRESDGHTHDWTVYVKPQANEDMSSWVKKVQFRLHDSYANPNRVVSRPPYEVSETGWGEFEVQIKVHFVDPNEKPITLYHVLKLFHTPTSNLVSVHNSNAGSSSSSSSAIPQEMGGDSSSSSAISGGAITTVSAVIQGRKSVISECYDEIVFNEPTQYLHTLLTSTRQLTLSAHKHEINVEERRIHTLERLQSGRKRVQEEIADFRERLELAKETISKFRAEISKLKGSSSSSTTSSSNWGGDGRSGNSNSLLTNNS